MEDKKHLEAAIEAILFSMGESVEVEMCIRDRSYAVSFRTSLVGLYG